jgi:hypothetical protein
MSNPKNTPVYQNADNAFNDINFYQEYLPETRAQALLYNVDQINNILDEVDETGHMNREQQQELIRHTDIVEFAIKDGKREKDKMEVKSEYPERKQVFNAKTSDRRAVFTTGPHRRDNRARQKVMDNFRAGGVPNQGRLCGVCNTFRAMFERKNEMGHDYITRLSNKAPPVLLRNPRDQYSTGTNSVEDTDYKDEMYRPGFDPDHDGNLSIVDFEKRSQLKDTYGSVQANH